MTLLPAYGRRYKSAKEVKTDFDAGKDFILSDFSSPYDGAKINKEQTKGIVNVRYPSESNPFKIVRVQ